MNFKSIITDIINRVKIRSINGLSFAEILNKHGRVFIVIKGTIILSDGCAVWYWDDPGPSRYVKLDIRGKSTYDVDGDVFPYEYITPSLSDKPLGAVETILMYPIVANTDMYPMFNSLYDAIRYLKTFKNHSTIEIVVDDDKYK